MSGNSSANIYPGAVPTAEEWNRLFENKVDATSGVLTGPIVLGNMELTVPPASALHAANKQYVDTVLGESNSLPEAPADGTPYCRSNNDWVPAPTTLTGTVEGDLEVPGNFSVGGTSTLIGNVQVGVASIGAYDLAVDGTAGAISVYAHERTATGQGSSVVDIYGSTSAAGWPKITLTRGTIDRGTRIGFNVDLYARWALEIGTDVVGGGETGSNAGSDMWLRRYDDAGTQLTPTLVIRRSTGNVLIGGDPGELPAADKLSVKGAFSATTITTSALLCSNIVAFGNIDGAVNGPIGTGGPSTGAFTTITTTGGIVANMGAVSQPGVVINATGTSWPAVRFNTTNAASAAGNVTAWRNGVARWTMIMGSVDVAESTGNLGSNLALQAFTDAGAMAHTPIYVHRASGNILMGASTFTDGGFKLDVQGGQARLAGLSFGSVNAGSNTSLTSHIQLYSTTFGFNVSSAQTRLNYVAPSGASHVFMSGATETAFLANTGRLTLASGLGLFGTSSLSTKPTVTGSRGGNVALASLLTVLASYGMLLDSSTA